MLHDKLPYNERSKILNNTINKFKCAYNEVPDESGEYYTLISNNQEGSLNIVKLEFSNNKWKDNYIKVK